eukprot:gene15882-18835_t
MTEKYDVVVIGAGSGGLSAVTFALKMNLTVALVEAEKTSDQRASGSAVHEYVQNAIQRVYAGESPEHLESKGATVMMGRATFIDSKEIEVALNTGETKRIRGAKYILCTGAGPVIPAFLQTGKVPYKTYLDIFNIQEIPRRVIVLGGGPIGSELAQALSRLGAEVTVFASAIMPREEPDVRSVMEKVFEEEGIKVVRARGKDAELAADGKSVLVKSSKGDEIETDLLLVTSGRKADVKNLGLEKAGVKFTESGVTVNKKLLTNKKHIAAAGDCIGGQQFTHLAASQAFTALRNLVLPFPENYDAIVPRVTFTAPEVGQVGLTESENLEKYGKKAKVLFRQIGKVDRGICEGETHGFFKIMYVKNAKVTGATIVCGRAGEITNELGVAIGAGMTLGALAKVMHAYPTFSFDIQGMAAEAAADEVFEGQMGGCYRWLAKRATR